MQAYACSSSYVILGRTNEHFTIDFFLDIKKTKILFKVEIGMQ